MIALTPPSVFLRGVGTNRNREFQVGGPCDGRFGGGAIASMTEDLTRQAIVIRKSGPFVGPVDGNGKRETFDEVCVPFSSVAHWTACDEKPEEIPAAKPVQQQQQSNQQRR